MLPRNLISRSNPVKNLKNGRFWPSISVAKIVPATRVPVEIDPYVIQFLVAHGQSFQKVSEAEQLFDFDGILTKLHLTTSESGTWVDSSL